MTPEELAKLPEYDYDKIIREEKPDASDQLRAAFVEEMEGRLYGRQQTLDAFAWFWSGWAASSGARSRYVHEIPDWMVIDAFRYACGRQSYQVGVTCRWLVENWERVPATAKTIIREELEKAFDEDNKQRSCGGMYGSMFLRLGSDIDRREWLAVLNLARYSAAQRCEGDQS